MSVTVKAYLTRANQAQPEIRRFTIDNDVITNFDYLIGKLRNVFPGLQQSPLTLLWKDSDGDEILFTSDQELMEALSHVTDGVFKVYVREAGPQSGPAPGPTQGPAPGSGVYHPGVTCDGCEGPIQGRRFKCEVCRDYDLCEACRSTGLHSEHAFKIIDTPVQHPHIPQFPFGPHGMFQNLFGGAPPMNVPPSPPPMRPGMPPHPHMGPGMFPPPPMGPGMCPPPPPMTPGMPPFWGLDPGMMRQQRRAWRHWMKQAFRAEKESRKAEKRAKHAEKKKLRKRNKSRKMETEESTEATAATAAASAATAAEGAAAAAENEKNENKQKKKYEDTSSSSSSSSEDSECEDSPNESYLKNVGQSVAALLNPLGIDVSIDIEHRGRTSRVSGGASTGCPAQGFAGMWSSPFCGQAWQGTAAGSQASTSQQTNKDKETGEVRTSAAAASSAAGASGSAAAGEGGSSSGSGGEGGDWTFIPSTAAAGVDGATAGVANMSVSGEGAAAQASASAASSSGTAASNSGAVSNDAVKKAVDLMKSMGFNDDDGWLTALLGSLSADVNAALEYISTQKQ